MAILRRFRADGLAVGGLFALALLWFAPVLAPGWSGVTLLPYDNLYGMAPWRSLQPGLTPDNDLLSDLVLENAVWKLHIRRTLAEGQLPLWNPQIFTGIPFLAAGQASTFYPLNILFYLFPLEAAYGWFTALQIGLAGVNLYTFGRVLGLRRRAALLSGLVFMFSGFLIVSVVFTMFVAAVVWLPLLLAIIEQIVRKQEEKGNQSFHPIPYVAVGAATLSLLILAGHPELIYYTLLVAGAYTLVRLLAAWRLIRQGGAEAHGARPSPTWRVVKLAGWLLLMLVVGVAGGGIQLLPLLELLPLNFRQGSASYEQVVGWAWPTRHVLTFFLPDIFGNPSHHHWFDLWSGQWVPATVNALGESSRTIFWGIKNYVEGGAYLSIATWLLAALAVLRGALAKRTAFPLVRPLHLWFFVLLALLSLLFAFGAPLYTLLFYGLPGWNQLHSPFRWVFPFTLSMAILAGMGLDGLLETRGQGDKETRGQGEKGAGGVAFTAYSLTLILSLFTALAGLAALLVVLLSLVWPERFMTLGQRVVDGSDLAQMAFADGRMFWCYQATNLLKFGLFALLAGLLVWWLARGGDKGTERWGDSETGRQGDTGSSTGSVTPSPLHPFTPSPLHLALLSLLALVALDLYTAHGRFNPAADVTLSPLNPANVPPVVQFIEEREAGEGAPWRFTTFNLPGEKTFNANVGMYYGWHDLRGYDSVIPKQYVQLMDRIAPQANELLYNRIAPLYNNTAGDPYAILDNPLLDLLNLKYVLSEHYLPNPTWREIYRDETMGVYENQQVMPRVFVAPAVQVAPLEQQPLLEADLRNLVFVEQTPTQEHALTPASPQLREAQISRYTANDVFVDLNLSDRGWLVLTDAYFPGWKAYLRPFGGDENQETELTIHRANGALRTVYLPSAGQWTVRFVYTPMSFKLGLYTSFVAVMSTLLLLLYWLWGRYYRPEPAEEGDSQRREVRVVAKNSLAPMFLNLANKVFDFAYAMLYVRLLGPEGTGKWYFVVAVYGVFEILSRYGLGTLLTRDVSADKNQSSRYLTNVIALRTLLWLVSLPVLALVAFGYRSLESISLAGFFTLELQNIGGQEVQALAILALSMLFANWADALSSTFSAFEKMEYPAGLSSACNLIKIILGPLVLLWGGGFIGLAAISLLVNLVQLVWFYRLLRTTLFPPEWRWDWPLQQWMLRTSGPLMINHLLATIFWRIDVWFLRPLAGELSVGLYSVGLKYLDGLNIIPSVFTMAIFPLMSRYARQESNSLLRAYLLSLRLLVMVSLPIAVTVSLLAEPLVYLVGGAKYLNIPETMHLFGRDFHYLGGSDLALRLIIWSIPIGFINSVTQYVLIAVNQQRFLTRAFLIGVLFNLIGNLLVIPSMGYVGATLTTILSELVLLLPFYYNVRQNVGAVPWLSLFARPLLAVVVMGLVSYGLMRLGADVWSSAFLGGVAYGLTLLISGALGGEDMAIVRQALPLGPLRRWLPVGG
jgi:O-antigen/teichoic acid export membrane protein